METINRINNIKDKFLLESASHGLAYTNGEYKKANKLHKKLHELYNTAKAENLLYIFTELIDNPNENIRLWAAIFSLKTQPDVAEKVLLDLALKSNIKLTAETTLKLWKAGMLNLL